MSDPLPQSIVRELAALLPALAGIGFSAVASESSLAFGNFAVTFSNGCRSVTLAKDRGQFIVQGERSELEPAHLWRAFSGPRSLAEPLIAWLQASGAQSIQGKRL